MPNSMPVRRAHLWAIPVVFGGLILLLFGSSLWAQRNLGGGFLPHGWCFTWVPGLLWLHVVSDGLIAIAYVTIPLTLQSPATYRMGLLFIQRLPLPNGRS